MMTRAMPESGSSKERKRKARLEADLAEARRSQNAANGLHSLNPLHSARGDFDAGQKWGFGAQAGAGLTFLLMVPDALAVGLGIILGFIFAPMIILRFSAVVMALLRRRNTEVAMIDIDLAPAFSLLVPLYREQDVARQSVNALSRLDYPTDKVQVLYLVEADDEDTISALHDAIGDRPMDIVVVPDIGPRTKPKALNFGLQLATGDIVTVYDAEDVPDPIQLRAAAAAFAEGRDELAVVQAPLRVHNGKKSWIAGQFDLEYRIHFDIWLPALTLLRAPIPLGGTSNHFRADILRDVGGWDAYNVTEDADLGLRLACAGFTAGMIDPPTLEEAPEKFPQWFSQRSRWIKGHVQSWLVFMRKPWSALFSLGILRFVLVQATFGAALLASLLHGPFAVGMMLEVLSRQDAVSPVYLGFFSAGYISALVAGIVAVKSGPIIRLLSLPLYWPLMSLAAIRALWELARAPYQWAKTRHGLTAAPLP